VTAADRKKKRHGEEQNLGVSKDWNPDLKSREVYLALASPEKGITKYHPFGWRSEIRMVLNEPQPIKIKGDKS